MTGPRTPPKPPGVQGGDRDVSTDVSPPAEPGQPVKDGGPFSEDDKKDRSDREGGMIGEAI